MAEETVQTIDMLAAPLVGMRMACWHAQMAVLNAVSDMIAAREANKFRAQQAERERQMIEQMRR